jgi:tRNA 2-thiouridine synthesizing protein E
MTNEQSETAFPPPELDPEGYLKNRLAWSAEIAQWLAAKEGIPLTPAHWEILILLRKFYDRYDHCPNNRILVNYIKKELGDEKGTSLYLLKLFPDAPAKRAARLAGLPKPTHCL